jgi:hypothetical protein
VGRGINSESIANRLDRRILAADGPHPTASNAIDGEFGIRLEDCLYITENGAKFFSQPSPAIDRPFA